MGHRYRRLDLFVTEACNLACPYCFARKGRPRPALSEADALRAVDWLLGSEHPRVHVTFWGGEPLLRRELLRRVADHARAGAERAGKGLSLSMPTNGTLLDDEAVAWLAGQRVQLFCSIDGEGEGRPLAAGGGSSYRLAIEGMRRARALAPAARMTVTPESAAGHADAALALVAEGVGELLIYPAMDRPWTAGAIEAFARAQLDLAGALERWLGESRDPARVPRLKAWRPILRRLVQPAPRVREGRLMDRQCGAGTDLVALGSDGSFAPCHRFVFYDRGQRYRMGTLDGGIEPGAGEPFAALRVEELGGEDGRCVACESFDLCGFGCVAISYATTGSLSRIPPWVCGLMRAQIEACRAAHGALAGDPRLAVYSGVSLGETLGRVAESVADRARELLDREG